MNEDVVALDLETTGLDPAEDRILEIGAVRFRNNQILDRWQSLVNPGLPVPLYITQLTGIATRDVNDAPGIERVLPQLRKFIGSAPLLGHNLQFDLAFLATNGLRTSNPTMDTFAISSALLPTAPRYNLSALASLLGVPNTDAHRALQDATATVNVYNELWKLAAILPLDTLVEIVRAGRQAAWEGSVFFEAALQARSEETARALQQPIADNDFVLAEEISDDAAQSLRPRREIEQVDLDKLAALIEPKGMLAQRFTGYEHRPQQVEMLRSVGDALNRGQQLMVEAPTGVGKSLAYLIPAIHFAVRNNDRVVISTNTINLQEQLIKKDIPLLQDTLEVPFRAAVLKGRSNYLCPRRLAALRRRGPTSPEETLMLARVLVWMTQNRSGDRGDLALRGPVEAAIWQRLSAEDEGCKLERCASQMGGACAFYKARRIAESAHLVVVNHALLLSDVATEGHVLPEYRYLIVDEAHHLEEATTNGLSFRTSQEVVLRQIADLGTAKTGLLGEMLRKCREAIPSGHFDTLSDFVSIVVKASSYMGQHVELFFGALQQFLQSQYRGQPNDYTQFIRVVGSTRRQPGWAAIETHWGNLGNFTSSIAEAMTRLEDGLRALGEFDIEEYDDLLAGVGAAARHLTELHERLSTLVNAPDPNTIYWAEIQPGRGKMSIHAAPLDIGPLVKKHLWDTKDTIVMTSATLQTKGSFRYIRSQLDADYVVESVIQSPFDYESSTLLYVVNDIAEPSEATAYQRALEKGILGLCRATQGRALILFTSHAQLRETASAIGDALSEDGIILYDQASGSSRTQLLDGFVRSEKAVLMGTRSFWEGVDVPGADLSVLAIARLPFNVPTDPIFAARSEQFDDPFMEYAIPETLLRFRQGFGRLIRRKTDRGVVVIFDRRIISKRYGQLFMDSLPKCATKSGPLADLPAVAARWLDSN